MGDWIRQILEELPNRERRSSLAPYCELILEMRRRGYSYRETARLLADRCGLRISHAAVHNFVRRHARALAKEPAQDRPPIGMRQPRSESDVSPGELPNVRARIAALKRRVAPSGCSDEAGFHFDPNQPLRLDDDQS